MADANLQSHDEAEEIEMFAGVSRRTLNHGDQTSIHELLMAKGSVVPEHTHPHEQTGYFVSGRLRFVMPGLAKDLDAGDSWIVPSEIPHEVTALEDSVAIDIFSPARTEYIP